MKVSVVVVVVGSTCKEMLNCSSSSLKSNLCTECRRRQRGVDIDIDVAVVVVNSSVVVGHPPPSPLPLTERPSQAPNHRLPLPTLLINGFDNETRCLSVKRNTSIPSKAFKL